MAGVPCVNDSCSIVATTDINGRLDLNVRLNPTGGLECGPDDIGLQARLFGDPAAVSAATLTECDNLLGITTEGDLFARRPSYERVTQPGINRALANDSTSADSTNFTYTNSDECSRLLILRTKFQVNFTVNNANDWEMDGSFVVELNGSPIAYGWTLGGPGLGETGSDDKIHSLSDTNMFTIGAGSSFTITTHGTRSDNVTTGISNTEFLASHTLILADLASGDLFS